MKYLPGLRKTENKILPSELSQRAQKKPESQREEVHAEVRYNSPQHCTDRVHAGQTSLVSPVNLLEQAAATQMPAA